MDEVRCLACYDTVSAGEGWVCGGGPELQCGVATRGKGGAWGYAHITTSDLSIGF